jgi:ABC-type antimicrobial peptide transport system permease subunit
MEVALQREIDAGPAVRAINPEAPFNGMTPLQDRIDRETAPRRFILQAIGLFSVLGLALAVIGVYSILAEFVAQRVPEIGVRVAFGATTGNVIRLVLGQGWRMALIGVPLGLAGAAALNGTMRAQVYGVSTLDPATYAVAALCLVLATLAACLVPARRAARLDPVAALRAE